jgi:hypothetical protein
MANGHGGYRRPTQPAAVSGPGRLSQRTDGGPSQPIAELPNAKYGEAAAFRAAEQAAPMSASPMLTPDLSGIVPMGAPSQRPEEPITAGMPFGPGAGSTGPALVSGMTPDQAERLRSYLPVLVLLASQDDADPATKKFVRQLRGELG